MAERHLLHRKEIIIGRYCDSSRDASELLQTCNLNIIFPVHRVYLLIQRYPLQKASGIRPMWNPT